MTDAPAMLARFAEFIGASSDAEIAKAIGVSAATIPVWRSRDSVPLRHFFEFSKRNDVNLNWLLLGEGPRNRQTEADAETDSTPGALASALEAAERGAEKDLGLGMVASLARLSTAGGEWRMMEALLRHPPEGCTLEAISVELGVTVEDVSAYAALLVKLGVVIEDEQRVRLREAAEISDVRSLGLPDRHQHALAAASYILQRVLPAIEERRGKLMLKRGRVSSGRATPLLERCMASVEEMTQEEATRPGEEDGFTIVMAVVSEPGPQ